MICLHIGVFVGDLGGSGVALGGGAGRSAAGHGRPTIAMESYVRLMVTKQRTGWGYEMLVRKVSDSLHLRRFCLIAIDRRVSDESTVRKLTRRFGRRDGQRDHQVGDRKGAARDQVFRAGGAGRFDGDRAQLQGGGPDRQVGARGAAARRPSEAGGAGGAGVSPPGQVAR